MPGLRLLYMVEKGISFYVLETCTAWIRVKIEKFVKTKRKNIKILK